MNTKIVCKRFNVSPKALRIYEDLGIIVPKRDENNYRNYSENDLLKLRQLILLKEMGIPLKKINDILIKDFDEENKMVRLLDIQLKATKNKIIELDNLKNTLEQSINEVLNKNIIDNTYFEKIDKFLNQNREKSDIWIDKWEFDTWAKNYDISVHGNLDDGLNLFEQYDLVLESVAEIILQNKAIKVIDIGCGTGNLYGKLNNNIEFTGIDQSIEMLLQAMKKYPCMNLRLGNFLDEPFIENEFDIVTSTFAFHHLNLLEKQKAINLLLKYLKSGGMIIIADLMFLNNKEKMKQKETLLQSDRKDLWDIIEDEYYTDIEEIKRYSEQSGCKVKYKHIVNFTWLLQIVKK
ncbi:MerR family transcriptional regulator [Clostridium butyricum]|uniref:MerR family transcriptional regulator n=1 Tax=Clostridium butyricum TaxID=1492 RepID=A0A512TTA3_CLOBU|nr:MerR family transcriptional regulator [Clostridium butyricum]NOW21833.1 putative AdoMet-dependent methyltransferase [Clostridium butyricum]GEQ23469.1 MerR family transcriptional regulator [Clostridium butyricum]